MINMNEENNSMDAYKILKTPSRIRSKAQIDSLLKLTQNVSFFKKITSDHNSSEIHKECCAVMTLEEYEANDIIINFGEAAKKFYIILSGSVSVLIPIKKKIKLTVQEYQHYEDLYQKDAIESFSESSSQSSNESFEVVPIPSHKPRRQQVNVINVKDLLEKLKTEEKAQKLQTETSNPWLETEEKLIFQLFKEKLNKEKKELLTLINEANQDYFEIEVDKMDEVGTLKEGDDFGDLALVSDRPRAATIIAKDHVCLLVLHKDQFKKILGTISEKRIMHKVKQIQNLPYFTSWSKVSLSKLAYYFVPQTITRKQPLFIQGQKVNGIFFIIQGEFVLTKKGEARAETLPYVFHSDTEKQTVQKIKSAKIFKDLKVIIKEKFESVGGYEIFSNFSLREYSCYCSSTQADVYFVAKENFLTKFPSLDMIRTQMQEENQRLEDRYRQLFNFEQSPAASEILQTRSGRTQTEKTDLSNTIYSKSFNLISPKKPGRKTRMLQTSTGFLNNFSFKNQTHSMQNRKAFRKLTDSEVHFAVNGRVNSVINKQRPTISIVRKRTPPKNFLAKFRKILKSRTGVNPSVLT